MAEKRTVVIDLITRTGGATRGVTGLQRNLTSLNKGTVKAKSNLGGMNKQMVSAKRGLSGLAGGMGSAGLAAGAMGAGVLVVGKGIQASLSAFSSFDDKMNQSIAIMGNVSDAMRDDMSKAAREMATTTRFSADEAAESYFFLASAGLDAQQSIAALPAVAAFGQAGMFDMALATDLLTDAQSSLGLTVDDSAENLKNMTRVSDVFVKANTLANTSVQQVSEAITNKLGGALRGANIDIEEGVAVLAAYADQGLKGASAGEAFNIVLRDFKNVNRESSAALKEHNIQIVDSEGNFRNMADIIADLEGAFRGLSVAEQAELANQLGFQDRSFKNIQLLIGQSDAIREYEEELRKAGGTTEEVAGKQMESFAAQMDVVGSKVHDAAITLGESLAPVALDVATAFGDMVTELGPLLSGLGSLLQLAFKVSGLKTMIDLITAAAQGWQRISGIWDESARSATVLEDATKKLKETIEAGEDPTTDLANAMNHLAINGELTADTIAELGATTGVTAEHMQGALKANLEWARAQGDMGAEVAALELALLDQIDAMDLDEEASNALKDALGLTHRQAKRTREAIEGLTDAEGNLVNANGDLIDSEGNLIDSQGNLINAMGDLVDAEGNVIEETLSLAEALALAEENQQSLADTMREFADPVFAASQAMQALREAEEDLAKVQDDHHASTEEVAEAELAFFDAILKAQGALDAFDASGPEGQVTLIMEVLGKSREEALLFLDALGLLDGTQVGVGVNTVFTASGSPEARAAAARAGTSAFLQDTTVLRRQHGGRAPKGTPLLVGEAGAELFVPGTSGMIVPNQALQGVTNNQDNRQRNLNVTFINPQLANDPVTGIRAAFARDRIQKVA